MNFLSTLQLPRRRSWSRPVSPQPTINTYEYETFRKDGEIRVLRLLAGAKRQPLECQLISVPLEGNPITYEALSYVWGSPEQVHAITCEGKSIPITKSLHTTLLHLRCLESTRDLWVDQISINQQDITERGKQVRMMAEIYQHAEQVIIWLGEESVQVDKAFKLVTRMTPILAKHGLQAPISPEKLEELGLPPHGSKEFDALGAVLKLPWFTRAWVVQEVGMSTSAVIRCGSISIPWSDFALAVSRLQSGASWQMGALYTYSGSPAERMGQIRSWSLWRHHNNTKADIFKIFSYIKNCEATDPRDKLFAFTNLANLKITPDYSLTASFVYIHFACDFVRRALRSDKSTWSHQEQRKTPHRVISGLLCNAGKLSQHLDLPSWVPDWSFGQDSRPLWTSKQLKNDLELAYSAGGDVMGECDLDGTRLRISGILLDTVSQAGRVDLSSIRDWSEKELQARCLDWWNECAAMHMLTPVRYVTGEARIEALKQTLLAGVNYDNEKASADWALSTYSHFQHYVHQRYKHLLVSKSTTSERNEMSSWPVVSTILGRVFFTTQRGYMGLAPYGVKPGDEVSVMLGCDIPLMLRRQSHGLNGPEFHLLGECFLHGIMFGEVMRDQYLPVTSMVLR